MSEHQIALVKCDFKEFIKFINVRKNLQQYSYKPLFGKYSPIYTFTTENLDSYLNEFDIKDKNCLTVTSSGDQIINLALLGASHIDCFDSNRITNYFTKLKIGGLQALGYDEFLDYFTSLRAIRPNQPGYLLENDNCFNYKYYSAIRLYLDSETKLFFDTAYEELNYDSKAVKSLFYNVSDERAMYNNTYLKNKENYYNARIRTKEIVKKGIKYYNLDIFDIPNISNKYDLILLSNIFDYIDSKKEEYSKFVEEDVTRILNPNGNVVLNYQYCYRQRKDIFITDNKAVYVKKFDERYFNISKIEELCNDKFTLIGIPTIYRTKREEGMEDCVYVYKK